MSSTAAEESMDYEEQKIVKQQLEMMEKLIHEVAELARQVKRIADKYAPGAGGYPHMP